MKKLIYVVKRGRKTGIFDEWKKCYEQTNGFSRALYRSFPYKTELEKEDENKEGSLRHAFMLAEQYLSTGEFKLVYQGRKKDYLEEDRWKREGFLPFGEEVPDDADNLEGEELPFASSGPSDHARSEEAKASFKQLTMHTESIGVELKSKIIGQDDAIDKLERAFFHAEKRARLKDKRKGPRNVYLFAGPPGVGKTLMAQEFAEKLGLPFRRFDMSGYSRDDVVDELAGISTLYKYSKPGVLTDYVKKNPSSVLLFDEIEKASGAVIMLFLQILDDGTCFDRHYDINISFEDTIIIFTTNAGKQRYRDAEDENLTALPDKLVLEALEKDINPTTNRPYFPPEMLSRLSSHTVIMLNHLRAEALRQVVEQDVETHLKETEEGFGYHLSKGQKILAQTVLYSMGGSADARNASRLAGKLIDQLLYEFMTLMMENTLPDNSEQLKEIEWSCDFTGATEEIQTMRSGTEGRDSTKKYYLELICSALGGRAAEMVFAKEKRLEAEEGLTHGPASDLEYATNIAADMVCKFGMYEEEMGMAVIGGRELKIGEIELKYDEKVKELINRILSEQLKEAIRIIESNKNAMEQLVKAVMDQDHKKKYLTREEIQEAAGELNKK